MEGGGTNAIPEFYVSRSRDGDGKRKESKKKRDFSVLYSWLDCSGTRRMEKSVEIPGQGTHRYLAVHHLLPVPGHPRIAPACNPSPTDGRCASIGISNSCSSGGDLCLVSPIMQSKGRDCVFEGIIIKERTSFFPNPFSSKIFNNANFFLL